MQSDSFNFNNIKIIYIAYAYKQCASDPFVETGTKTKVKKSIFTYYSFKLLIMKYNIIFTNMFKKRRRTQM